MMDHPEAARAFRENPAIVFVNSAAGRGTSTRLSAANPGSIQIAPDTSTIRDDEQLKRT